jgi:phospholipid/cholesterol/gamma-HCH transport system substrate-binding protein
MDLLGGGHLGSYFKQLNSLLENMSLLIEAFSDPRRSKALIGMFDELLPTLKDLREFSQQMTHNKNLKISMENISQLTRDINRIMPEMAEFSKKLPELGVSSAKTMEQLSKVTEELNKILPTVARVAPNLPEATQRSVEALKEAVIVLKAMQKSFLLRGAVKDVQEEQAKIDEETKTLGNKNREPSSEK